MLDTSARATVSPMSRIGIADSVQRAVCSRRGIGRAVSIGWVRGIVIGYNIAPDGAFPGDRFPLLVETEFGTGKFGLDEVTAI